MMASDDDLTVVKWAGSVLRVHPFWVKKIKNSTGDAKVDSMEGGHMTLRSENMAPIEEVVIDEAGNEEVTTANLPRESRDLYDDEGEEEAHVSLLSYSITQLKGLRDQLMCLEVSHEEQVYVWYEANYQELKQWDTLGVCDIVKREPHHHVIKGRWVLTTKVNEETLECPRYKARYVAKGFQEVQCDMDESSAPTIAKESWRLMLVICVNNDWVPSSLDIKTAFLQGRGFDKEVLLEPPMEANVPTGHAWRLKKPVYGLKEASLNWYESLMDFLESHGGMRTTIASCLVMFTSMGTLCGMMAIHVDDICYAGTRQWKEGFIPECGRRFPFGSEKHGSFTYIGLEVSTLLSEDGHIVGFM